MNIITKIINTILLLLIFSSSLAEVTAFEELQYDSEEQVSIATPTDPNLLWQQYLSNENIKEGANVRGERIFLIAYAEAIVGDDKNDSNFMVSRNVAFDSALAAAKKQMAAYLSSEIKSKNILILSEFSNEVPNRLKEEVGVPLSIMDKAATLTGLSLDDKIKKFDPNWDGTKKTDDERIVKMAQQGERFTKYLTSRSIVFLQGTTPIFNAEGTNDQGKYVVAVGIVWSGKSARVAESVYNKTVAPPQGNKNALTIQDRLDNLSDKELAATLGVRVWWDEEGLPVVVSFAQAKGTGSTLIAKDKTYGYAAGQITAFVAEQIVFSGYDKIDQEIHYYDDDSHTAFNLSEYQMKIDAIGTSMNLKGAETVLYKKIVHPISEKRIVVNVVTWSSESNMIAIDLGASSDDDATKMDATKGGTVFENDQESTDNNSVGTVSTIGLEGVSSNSDDF
jgi:hypothetical protein